MDDAERAEVLRYLDTYIDGTAETLLTAARVLAFEPRNRAARQLVASATIELQRFLDIRANLGRGAR